MGLPASNELEVPATSPYPRLAYSGGEPPETPRRRGSGDNAVVATAIFLGTEVMIFAALISAFLILRAGAASWPPVGQPRLPVEVTGLNTLVLLFSAFTMRRAASLYRPRDHRESVKWLTVTAALGAAFLLVQGGEWLRLLGFGMAASTSLYGGTFYTLIGCHGLHVLAAVATVTIVAWSLSPETDPVQRRSRLEACQLYWLFVVAVWPVLYVLVYLT